MRLSPHRLGRKQKRNSEAESSRFFSCPCSCTYVSMSPGPWPRTSDRARSLLMTAGLPWLQAWPRLPPTALKPRSSPSAALCASRGQGRGPAVTAGTPSARIVPRCTQCYVESSRCDTVAERASASERFFPAGPSDTRRLADLGRLGVNAATATLKEAG